MPSSNPTPAKKTTPVKKATASKKAAASRREPTKVAKKTTKPRPTPAEIAPPDPEVQIDVSAAATSGVKSDAGVIDFKRSAPVYDLKILDAMIERGRGDLAPARDSIVTAVDDADNKSDLMHNFKKEFADNRVLNMPLLNEAVNNEQTIAWELRGKLWKSIKSLPST